MLDIDKELVEEAQVLRGMVAEIRAKLLLLRNSLLEEKKEKVSLGDKLEISSELNQKIAQSILRYNEELSKYSHRLEHIYEELGVSNEFNFLSGLDAD